MSIVIATIQVACLGFVLWGGALCLLPADRKKSRRAAGRECASDFDIGYRRAA
jgi:hypothetical protein